MTFDVELVFILFMADGFENKLSLEQMADLIEFLNRPDTKLLANE